MVSDFGTGRGPAIDYGNELVMNAGETILYVSDLIADALFKVAIATGNRTLVSDSGTGSGTNFGRPGMIYTHLRKEKMEHLEATPFKLSLFPKIPTKYGSKNNKIDSKNFSA